MKTLHKITLLFALVALFVSCQSVTDVNKILLNQDTKKAIMDTIANDSNLSSEMMETMMNSENSKMMMENHGIMMKMMKDNPGMMQSMMTNMIKICESDSAMMTSMHKTMMENPQMMDMMHKMIGAKMEMKGMKKMEGMDQKTK